MDIGKVLRYVLPLSCITMADDRKVRLAALAAKATATTLQNEKDEEKIGKDSNSNDIQGDAVSTDLALDTTSSTKTQPTIKFRNYVPQSKELAFSSEKYILLHDDNALPDNDSQPLMKKRRAEAGDDGPSSRIVEEDINDENDTTPALEKALQSARRELLSSNAINEVEISALAPRKVNWDLKRDVQPKLDKLERRTQRAIVELLHQRLELEAGAEDYDDDDLD
jgi:hypothetical protein